MPIYACIYFDSGRWVHLCLDIFRVDNCHTEMDRRVTSILQAPVCTGEEIKRRKTNSKFWVNGVLSPRLVTKTSFVQLQGPAWWVNWPETKIIAVEAVAYEFLCRLGLSGRLKAPFNIRLVVEMYSAKTFCLLCAVFVIFLFDYILVWHIGDRF